MLPLESVGAAPNHQLVDLMGRVHAEEAFVTPDHSLQLLKSLSYDQFEDLLTRANGICREIATGARTLDGRGTIAESLNLPGQTRTSMHKYSPPAKEDRRMLMEEALRSSQQLDDPEQAATMLGLMINIIHPFNDGNGRTSRMVYSLLTRGYDGSKEDQSYYTELLANTSGRRRVDLNPEHSHLPFRFNMAQREKMAKHYGYGGPVPTYAYGGYSIREIDVQGPDELLVNDSVSPEGRKVLHQIVKDDIFDATVFFDYLLESGKDPSGYIKLFDNGQRRPLMLDDLLPKLTDEEILHLADKQDELKEKYAKVIIDVFADPANLATAAELAEFYRPKANETTIA